MAKYSTNRSGGGDDGDSCELCGTQTTKLTRANVAGADLLVCSDCAPHGSNRHQRERKRDQERDRDQSESETSRKKRTAQRAARMYDQTRGDSSRWEREGTNYEKDRLPYLVTGYADRVSEARQEAGLQRAELAAELGVDEADITAVEQGRAARAGVGGSLIGALEERLGVELVDE
jgi:ribosome-binding protein aMBF1 (putative translation factor)